MTEVAELGVCFALRSDILTANQLRHRARGARVICSQQSAVENTGSSLRWAKDGGVEWNSLSIHNFPGGVRGMIAEDKIEASKVCIKVPKDMVIEANTIPGPNPISSFVSGDFWKSQQWWVRLGTLLLYEKVTAKRKFLQGYVQALPKSFDTPFHWKDSQLAETQYYYIQRRVLQQQQDWKKIYDRFKGDYKGPREITFEEFVWALECVRSRAFSGEIEATPFPERLRTIAFAGAISVAALLFRLSDTESVLNGLSLAIISLLGYDILYPRIQKSVGGEVKRYVLCPVVDFCNHLSNTKSDLSYEYFYSSFVLKTGDFNPGEQVFISYGDRSNDQLLQYYGFIEEDNPHDVYVFGNTLDEVFKKIGVDTSSMEKKDLDVGPIVLFQKNLRLGDRIQETISSLLGGDENAKSLLRDLCKQELEDMPTSLEEDLAIKKPSLAVQFRIEKKKLLSKTMESL